MDDTSTLQRTKHCEVFKKNSLFHSSNSGKTYTNKGLRSDSMSKLMSGDSTMCSRLDSKIITAQSLKSSMKSNPVTVFTKKTGLFEGFAGYSYKNNKKINEDKLDININFLVNNSINVSLYSIYDGHGGEYVADYLKDNLHKELIANEKLLVDSKMTILDTFEKIEMDLIDSIMNSKGNISNSKTLSQSQSKIECNKHNLSGSCALLLMTMDDKISIVNLGDSRGIISTSNPQNIFSLSIDHNLNNKTEKKRIIACGGSILRISNTDRVFPGGLSVTRSFGDFELKIPKLKGKLNAISAIPDIITIEYKNDMDFIILGSDGLYEYSNNKLIVSIVYSTMQKCIIKDFTYQSLLEKIIYKINKHAIKKGAKDNISCIFLPFSKFKEIFDTKDISAIDSILSHIKACQISGERLYENISDSFIYTYDNDYSISSSINLMKKSTLMYQNICLYEQSFSKSNISLESNIMPQNSDEYETSDEVNKKETNHPKTSKFQLNCCGLFT